MASEVDICNLALGNIGDAAEVTAIDPPDGSAQAVHCARFYPVARDAMLERHAWRFAKRRETLAELTNDSDTWAYKYALPNNCLRPLAVLLPESTDDTKTQDFVSETDSDGDDVIYTNVEDAVLVFIARVTDTAKFSPLFVIALARLLASFLAGPVWKETDGKRAAAQRRVFEELELPQAIASDAMGQQNNAYGEKHTPAHISARS